MRRKSSRRIASVALCLMILGILIGQSVTAGSQDFLPYCVGCNNANYRMQEMTCTQPSVVNSVLIKTEYVRKWMSPYEFWEGNPYHDGLWIITKIVRTYRVTFRMYCCETQMYDNYDYHVLPECGWEYWTERITVVTKLPY